LRRCRRHLPLRRNRRSVAIGSNPIFAVHAVGGQLISVLVSSCVPVRKDVSSISVLTRNGNGSYGTAERQRNSENQASVWPFFRGIGAMSSYERCGGNKHIMRYTIAPYSWSCSVHKLDCLAEGYGNKALITALWAAAWVTSLFTLLCK